MHCHTFCWSNSTLVECSPFPENVKDHGLRINSGRLDIASEFQPRTSKDEAVGNLV